MESNPNPLHVQEDATIFEKRDQTSYLTWFKHDMLLLLYLLQISLCFLA